ncbi:hypothetical protein [Alteromonas sp. C1M14]|uniref:hypothetical protein n=1 Tax=Alteromonas sp. C1M14 TaxID=2841567 RepID=UPI001C0A0A2D|nr:hypothetical protein [Alteromonas sp. C1M14]MBU2976615.1 hypothetical protein [Alteromonas sp. C1M14]
MNTTKSLLSGVILSTALLGANAMAQENAIESFLSHVVTNAVSMAGNEIQADVRQSIANMTYSFSLEGDSNTGTVSVTELSDTESVSRNTPTTED